MALSADRRLQWEERIAEQKRSSLSQRKWCEEKGISLQTFHYWQKKLAPQMDRSAFKELKGEAGIVLHWRGVELRVESDFDALTLRKLLTSVSGCLPRSQRDFASEISQFFPQPMVKHH